MDRRVWKLIKKIRKKLRKSAFHILKSRECFEESQWLARELKDYLRNEETFEKIMKRIYREAGFSFLPQEFVERENERRNSPEVAYG